MKYLLLFYFIICGAVFLGGDAWAEDERIDVSLKALADILPTTPAVATDEILLLMNEVATTKRLDAAYLLIGGLAFNMNPDIGGNESLGAEEMIPSITLMKIYFDKEVLPLLMYEGLTEKEEWFRKRVALAIRYIATKQEIQELVKVFSLRVSGDRVGSNLATYLESEELEVELYSPIKEGHKELIEELKRRGIIKDEESESGKIENED